MKIKITLFLLIGIILSAGAQIAPDKYYIQFTDKNDSPYSIDNPGEFLTQRAIDRRERQSIPIAQNDIPVNQSYLLGVATFDVQLLNPTKWFNGVTVYATDPNVIIEIGNLPYVSNTLKLSNNDYIIKSKFEDINGDTPNFTSLKSSSSLDYGASYGQIDQLNGIPLHDQNYQGQGMVIAVLDAGFHGVLEQPVFQYILDNGRILGTKDFVYVGGDVYEGSNHGKSVLSCMAANLSGQMIGTAPEAEYWLLRSEQDPGGENIIEEYNWVSAAEYADSVGADIINSSLSYFTFDLPQWDHQPGDMDGNTAIATIGADIAASKGIIVCNSAGNSGALVGAPADGDSVLTVGAVDGSGYRAGFSSIGPTADGRIKPNVMAWGQGTTIVNYSNEIGYGSGTSFSSPVLAGMVACLWQSHPEMTAMEVQESIMESGSYANDPDNYMGWGIPNFAGADSILTSIETNISIDKLITVGPNPFNDVLNVKVDIDSAENIRIELINVAGNIVFIKEIYVSNNELSITLANEIATLSSGIYFLKVITKGRTEVKKVIRR